MARIDADALLPNDRVKQAALAGEVTQLSRGGSNRYAEPGDTFELDGTVFEVTAVEERTLGDLTDADASARVRPRWTPTGRAWRRFTPATSSGTRPARYAPTGSSRGSRRAFAFP